MQRKSVRWSDILVTADFAGKKVRDCHVRIQDAGKPSGERLMTWLVPSWGLSARPTGAPRRPSGPCTRNCDAWRPTCIGTFTRKTTSCSCGQSNWKNIPAGTDDGRRGSQSWSSLPSVSTAQAGYGSADPRIARHRMRFSASSGARSACSKSILAEATSSARCCGSTIA